jgi:hypothetical protein
LIVVTVCWTMLSASAFGVDQGQLKADGKNNVMPVRWEQVNFNLIPFPDKNKLERGEIQYAIEKAGNNTVLAQTIGLIKAKSEDCFKVVRSYNLYTRLMPCTVESKMIRSFILEGENAGAEAVDFWTRVRVFGFYTRYLLRIAHLPEPQKQQFRSFWTLVDTPDQLTTCLDSERRPCQNDLVVNLGSHQFETFPGNPNFTLHTYTLIVSGKSWLQRTAFHLGGTKSMGEVTLAIRRALEK